MSKLFRLGKPQTRIEHGRKIFLWPLQTREVGPPMSGWHEMDNYPTRKAGREAVRKLRTEEQIHRARLKRA